MPDFTLGTTTLKFSSNYEMYTKIFWKLAKGVDDSVEKYRMTYNDLSNIEKVIARSEEVAEDLLKELFASFSEEAIANGIYNYNFNLLDKNTVSRILHPIKSALSDVEYNLAEINDREDNEKRARQIRKATRGRVVGGGFGFTGAVKGMATAGAINVATGAAHSAFNLFGDIFSSMSASSDRSSLYNNAKKYLFRALRESLWNLLDPLCRIFNCSCNVDIAKENNIFTNIINGNIPKESLKRAFADAFVAFPFDKNLYEQYLKLFADDEDEIKSMASYFQVDLSDISNILCTVHGFKFNKIKIAHYARTQETWLNELNIFDDSEFIKLLFDKKFLTDYGDYYLLKGLIEKYNGQINAPEGFEEVNTYREYMVGFLSSLLEQFQPETTMYIPLNVYKDVVERLYFKISIIYAFFKYKQIEKRDIYRYKGILNSDKAEPFLKCLKNFNIQNDSSLDLYFTYCRRDEYIIASSAGFFINEHYWLSLNPNALKYDDGFFSSSLFSENEKIGEFVSIGNNLSYVIKAIQYIHSEVVTIVNHYRATYGRDANIAKELAEQFNDDREAYAYYFCAAALNGNSDYQYTIANTYYFGNNIEQNYSMAKYWYQQALKNGDANAGNVIVNFDNIPDLDENYVLEKTKNDFGIRQLNLVPVTSIGTEKNQTEEVSLVKTETSAVNQTEITMEDQTPKKADDIGFDRAGFNTSVGFVLVMLFIGSVLEGWGYPTISGLVIGFTGLRYLFCLWKRVGYLGISKLWLLLLFIPYINLGFLLYLSFAGNKRKYNR